MYFTFLVFFEGVFVACFDFSIDFEMLVRFGFTNLGGEGYTVILREAMKE